MAGALFGALFGGIGLVFLRERYLDRSVRRPVQVESELQLPLFLSIPVISRWGSVPASNGHAGLIGAGNMETPAPEGKPKRALNKSFWKMNQRLGAYLDALRDRLILHFEINELTHKPKLIAVTSCGEDAGVSSIAAGLAASLSETGEGNVLLVDMNQTARAPYHFQKGVLKCDLDEMLEGEKRNEGQVNENLYVVKHTAENGRLSGALPKRFNHLVPKLKASDYDYIIFDMPPVSQISLTPRLARFMDMVLMVVESGRTHTETARRAGNLLTESGAKLGVVLNKTKRYVPRWLEQEL